MNLVIDKFVEVLSMAPEPVLSSDSLGVKRPSTASDVPAVVISLSLDKHNGSGIGRFIRAGDIVVKHTAKIEVKPNTEAFSGDLRLLQILPRPLKKNPSSVTKEFTENDVNIRDVTAPSNPVDYSMANKPTNKREYKLDVLSEQIIFGKAQTEGAILEVVHWATTRSEDVRGDRYSGSMILEIWVKNSNETGEISRRLQDKLMLNGAALRQKGFLKFQPASLEPIENVQYQPNRESTFEAWEQKLGYRFAFEAEEDGEFSSGIPIKRIGVDMDKGLVESFSIPK